MINKILTAGCIERNSARPEIRRIIKSILSLLLILSLNASISPAQSISINALSFDGVDDYVSIGYVNYFFGSSDFTIEARFRDQAPAGGNSEEVIISSQSAASTNGFRVSILNGQLTTFLGGNSYTVNSADLRDNTCHHLAMTRQSGIVRHYLDGNLLGPVYNSADNVDSPDPILIGIKRINGGLAGSFNGLLKELRIWTGGRSQSQIQLSMNMVPWPEVDLELLGYWRFNEGSGQLISCCQGNVSPGGFLGASSAIESADPVWTIGCPSCLPPTAYISSSSPVLCVGGSTTLTANTATGTSFQWSFNGSTIGGATNATYVTTTTGNYSVQVSSSCGSTTAVFTLAAGSLPSPVISTNNATTFCQGGSAFLFANNDAVTYQWKRNGNAIAGATVAPYTATTSGTYTVTETNSCGSANSNAIVITVNTIPVMPGIISGPTSVCKKQTKTYSISSVSGATTYTWTVPTGSQILSGQGTTTMTVKFGAHGGNITVKASNTCGISPVRTLAVAMNCRETDDVYTVQEITVFPNPSSTHFTLQFDANLEGIIKLDVRDITGKQIDAIENIQPGSELTIGENWTAGIYFVTITGNDKVIMQKVVKQE